MIKEKFIIVQRVDVFRGNEFVEQKIKPVAEYPYSVEKHEAIEIVKRNPGVYLALSVLTIDE